MRTDLSKPKFLPHAREPSQRNYFHCVIAVLLHDSLLSKD